MVVAGLCSNQATKRVCALGCLEESANASRAEAQKRRQREAQGEGWRLEEVLQYGHKGDASADGDA